MYYATYNGIGESDIAVFKTEKERDDWINYRDPYSKALRTNAKNSFFERVSIPSEQALSRIATMLRIKDTYNTEQEWYCLP